MNQNGLFAACLLSLAALLFACQAPVTDDSLPEGLYAQITTKHGDFVCRLEHQRAPLTVANFVALAEGDMPNDVKGKGEPYYDGMTFHRVSANFVIQGGDPLANGMGGPGYAFKDEFHPDLKHNAPGTLSMANAGPATNGSQFFVTHRATPHLDERHSVFGYVNRGLKNVYKVQASDTIQSIRIIRNGSEAQKFDAVAVFEELK